MFEWLREFLGISPQPKIEIQHPEFGLLSFDSGLWCGENSFGGRLIRFCVPGTDTTPDSGSLDQLRVVLSRFQEYETLALDFLCSPDERIRPNDFHFYSLVFLWEDMPNYFVYEFVLDGDIDGIWRVEFKDGIPFSTNRDD